MIEQILVGSTVNVTPTTMDDIDNHRMGVTTFSGPYGSFIAVIDDPVLEQKLIQNKELLLLTALAREHGCTWIYLDRDADPIEILPTYENEWTLHFTL